MSEYTDAIINAARYVALRALLAPTRERGRDDEMACRVAAEFASGLDPTRLDALADAANSARHRRERGHGVDEWRAPAVHVTCRTPDGETIGGWTTDAAGTHMPDPDDIGVPLRRQDPEPITIREPGERVRELTADDFESVERFVAHCRHALALDVSDVIATRRYRALRVFANGSAGHLVAIFARNEPDRALDGASELDAFADQLGGSV